MTQDLRSDDQLLILYVKPHKGVHVAFIRRWILDVMALAAIDTDVF